MERTQSNGFDQYPDSLFRAGLINADTASILKTTPSVVIESNVARPSKNAERDGEIRAAYRRGKTQCQIATDFGLSQGRVSQILSGASISDHEDVVTPSAQEFFNRLAEAELLLVKMVATVNQHADDGNADQKRIVELESEVRLLWKRLDGMNQELNQIEDALPLPQSKNKMWWSRLKFWN
jgi:transcriptional regulator with XRE-family HTH domain